MKPVVLRAEAAGERERLLDLWHAAWTLAMPEIDFAARRAEIAARWTALESAGARTIVAAEPEGPPLGFMTLDVGRAYLDQLAVAPAAQRRGIGRLLLVEARRLSPGGFDLHVNQSNAPAIRLYEREGLVRTGTGVNPRSGLPILSMRWPGSAAASSVQTGAQSAVSMASTA